MIPVHIEKLQPGHSLESFDCRREALNRFLIRLAFQNQQAGASQTWLALPNEEVAGSGLLKDAMMRTLQAADIAGIRAFAVHAKDDEARAFYERYDLFPRPLTAAYRAVRRPFKTRPSATRMGA